MKLLSLNNKEIEKCLSKRYIYGYKLHDIEYDKIKSLIIAEIKPIKDQTELIDSLKKILGDFNPINEEIYYELIGEYVQTKMHKEPTLDIILNIL